MSFARILHAELMKLRRSLILLLIGAVPAMVLILLLALRLTRNGSPDWENHALSGAGIWAMLLLPLTATALNALLAQVEHGPRTWSDVLALPHPKWTIFAAKALLSVGVMAGISVLLWAVILLGGLLPPLLRADATLTGELPAALLAVVLLKMWIAGLLVMAVQFVVAMRIQNFAAPIVVGIGGTFFAVAATAAKAGVYFPWLLPVNMLASDPARAQQALWLGGVGGLVLMTAGCMWLSRRDWA